MDHNTQLNFARANFALRSRTTRNIRVILRDVRTAACHKYRQFASLQIASAPFYYEANGVSAFSFDWILNARNILRFEKFHKLVMLLSSFLIVNNFCKTEAF